MNYKICYQLKTHCTTTTKVNIPPHVCTSFNHAEVLESAVEVVLFAVFPNVVSHLVLQFDGNGMFRHIQMGDICL